VKRLLVVGAGGHGKVVADTAEQISCWDLIEFVDLEFPKLTKCGPWDVVAKDLEELTDEYNGADFVVAIGDNKTRMKVFSDSLILDFNPVSLILPTAYVSKHSAVCLGSVIFANASINVNATIGRGAIINTGATVDHDCLLAEGIHISPGANLAGEVSVGCLSWIGIGASIKQQIKIGENVTVGSGAAVVNDIPDFETVIGVPAKPIEAVHF